MTDSHVEPMTPAGDAMAPPVVPSVAADVLHDGEEIILAIRPSMWMVVLESLPAAALAGIIAGVILVIEPRAEGLSRSVSSAALLGCALLVALRVGMVFLRWVGRLYILTNRRALRLGGVAAVDVADCPLERITAVRVMSGSAERVAGLGTLVFTIDGQLSNELGWTNIAQPVEVAEQVAAVIRRHHGNGHSRR